MSKERMSWAEMLDVLTDSDREKRIVVERATEKNESSEINFYSQINLLKILVSSVPLW